MGESLRQSISTWLFTTQTRCMVQEGVNIYASSRTHRGARPTRTFEQPYATITFFFIKVP